MIIEIDFNSDEAIYIQLRNQIIMGIATSQLMVGDSLPSVRQLADHIGINMHTVNKAYSVLRQEGYIKLDRRKGAVIAIDYDQVMASRQIMAMLQPILAEAICKNISREDVHDMVDVIYHSLKIRTVIAGATLCTVDVFVNHGEAMAAGIFMTNA